MEGDRPKSLAEFKEIFNKCIDQYLTDTPSDCVISKEKSEQILKVLQNDPDFTDTEIKSYVKQDKIQLQDFPLLQLKNVLCTVKKGRKTANRLNDDLFGRFRRVVLKEEFFDTIYKAHSQHGSRDHIGFEKTIFQLKRNYSHIPCEIVLKFMKMCPVCAGTVTEEDIPLFCVKYEDDPRAESKSRQDPEKYIKKGKPKKVIKLPQIVRKARVKAKTTTTTTTARVRGKSKATTTKRTQATARRGGRATMMTTKKETASARQPKTNTNIKISNKIFGERYSESQQDHDYVRTRHYLPITYSLAGPRNSSVSNPRDYSNNQRVHVLRASYFMAVGKVSIIDIQELLSGTSLPNQFSQVVHYVDLWSKFNIFWPLCYKDISELASGIAKNVFAYFGAPRQLIYNGCSMQEAGQLEESLRVWSSQINVTTGILEEPLASSGLLHWRIFDELKNLPRESWESHLSKLQYLSNTKLVKTHGRVTPFEAVFGHPPFTETFAVLADNQNKTPANGNMTDINKKPQSFTEFKGSKVSTTSDVFSINFSGNQAGNVATAGVYEAQLGSLPPPPVPVACTINIANRSTRSLLPSTLTLLHQASAPTCTSDSMTFAVSKKEPTGDPETVLMEVDSNNTTAATTTTTTPSASIGSIIAATTTITDSTTTSTAANTPTVKVEVESDDNDDDDVNSKTVEIKPDVDHHDHHRAVQTQQTTVSAVETVDAAISMIRLHHHEKDNSVIGSANRKRILKKPTLKLPSRCKNTASAKILRCYQAKVKQNLKIYAHYRARGAQHRTANNPSPKRILVENFGGTLPEFSGPDPEQL